MESPAAIRPVDAIRFASRLRAVLGLSTSELALVVGVDARTLNRMETWSGSLLTAILLLGEVPASEAADRLFALAEMHASRLTDPPDPADVSRLRSKVAEAMQLTSPAPADNLSALCSRSVSWIYWATTARADDIETKALADEAGLICRPLLQSGTHGKWEVHSYLFALRPGDGMLLCHNAKPVAWYLLQATEGKLPNPRTQEERLRRAPKSERSVIDLLDALPDVLRFVEARGTLGRRLESSGYRLFDGSDPSSSGSAWYSALAVEPDASRELPTKDEFGRRSTGERARISFYRARRKA